MRGGGRKTTAPGAASPSRRTAPSRTADESSRHVRCGRDRPGSTAGTYAAICRWVRRIPREIREESDPPPPGAGRSLGAADAGPRRRVCPGRRSGKAPRGARRAHAPPARRLPLRGGAGRPPRPRRGGAGPSTRRRWPWGPCRRVGGEGREPHEPVVDGVTVPDRLDRDEAALAPGRPVGQRLQVEGALGLLCAPVPVGETAVRGDQLSDIDTHAVGNAADGDDGPHRREKGDLKDASLDLVADPGGQDSPTGRSWPPCSSPSKAPVPLEATTTKPRATPRRRDRAPPSTASWRSSAGGAEPAPRGGTSRSASGPR